MLRKPEISFGRVNLGLAFTFYLFWLLGSDSSMVLIVLVLLIGLVVVIVLVFLWFLSFSWFLRGCFDGDCW